MDPDRAATPARRPGRGRLRDDDFSTVGWSSTDGSTWTPLGLTTALKGAQIERAVPLNGSILLLGQLRAGGVYVPADWILTP